MILHFLHRRCCCGARVCLWLQINEFGASERAPLSPCVKYIDIAPRRTVSCHLICAYHTEHYYTKMQIYTPLLYCFSSRQNDTLLPPCWIIQQCFLLSFLIKFCSCLLFLIMHFVILVWMNYIFEIITLSYIYSIHLTVKNKHLF